MFNNSVDTSGFEKVCFLIFQRVKKLDQVPMLELCHAISDLADEHSNDTESPYSFCLPDQVGFGHLAYPHEYFLERNNLLSMEFWKKLTKSFRGKKIVDPEIIGFSNELCTKLGIEY